MYRERLEYGEVYFTLSFAINLRILKKKKKAYYFLKAN